MSAMHFVPVYEFCLSTQKLQVYLKALLNLPLLIDISLVVLQNIMSPVSHPPSVASQQGVYAHHPHTPHTPHTPVPSHPSQHVGPGWGSGHPPDSQSVLSPANSVYIGSPQPIEEQPAMTPGQQVPPQLYTCTVLVYIFHVVMTTGIYVKVCVLPESKVCSCQLYCLSMCLFMSFSTASIHSSGVILGASIPADISSWTLARPLPTLPTPTTTAEPPT